MTRKTKIIISVIVGVIGLCLIICGVGYMVLRNFGQQVVESAADTPEEAAALGREIADFDLPAGYTAETGMNLMGVKMVFYSSKKSSDNMIMLMQMPMDQELTEAEFEQLRTQMENQSGRRLENIQTLHDKPITLRGKPGRIVLQEGDNASGVTFRQLMVAFSGKDGLAMLVVTGPASTWDQNKYNKMIKTIR